MAAATLTCALIYSGYAQRGVVDAARFPQVVAEASDTTTELGIAFDELDDHHTHSVVFLAPSTPDSPLPPGLDSWPAPGEAALSPELRRLGEAQGIERRYGLAVHTIGPDGLGAPDERLAYVRPDGDEIDTGARLHADGFGLPGPVPALRVGATGAYFGESLNIESLRLFLPAAVIFVLVPAAGALLVVRRRLADRLGRRELLLEALGAPPSLRRGIRLRLISLPAICGLGFGTILIAAPVLAGVRLPFTQFLLSQGLITDRPLVTAIALTTAAAATAAALTTRPARRSGTNRPAQIMERADGRWLLAGPTAVLGALWAPDLVDPGGGWVWAITYWLGVLATFALVPISIAVLVTKAMEYLRRLARARGWPAVLVPSAWLAAAPMTTLRCAATLTVASGLLFQGLVWTQGANEYLDQALEAQQVVDDRIVELRASYSDGLADFITAELLEDVGFVRREHAPDGTAQLIGTCADLASLSVPCDGTTTAVQLPEPARTALGYGFGDSSIRGVVANPVEGVEGGAVDGYLFDRSLTAGLDVTTLNATVWAHAASATVSPVGQGWVIGASNQAHQGTWVILLGCLGLAAVLLALAADIGGRLQEHARRTGVLTALSGRARDHWVMAAVVAIVPTLGAGGLAYLAHAIAIQPFVSTPPGGTSPTAMVLPPFAITCVGVALVSCLLVALTSQRASWAWAPQGDAHV